MAKRTARASITITVKNWDKYNVRNHDYKRPWWFSLNNRILEDADVYTLTDAEFRAWTYVLSQASIKKSATVTLELEHAERACKVSSKALFSLVEKFKAKSILSESGQNPIEIRPGSGLDLARTEQDITEQNNTEQDKRVDSSADALPSLALVWNSNCEPLPKVIACNTTRKRHAEARWRERPENEFWVGVINRIKLSPFCRGKNDRGWRADFDWLIKPETANKVLEGRYDESRPEKKSGIDWDAVWSAKSPEVSP